MTTEQRLERLERENRWMRRIAAVGAVALVLSLSASVYLVTRQTDAIEEDAREEDESPIALAERILGKAVVAEAQVRSAKRMCSNYHSAARTWLWVRRKYPDSLEAMEAPLRAGDDKPFIKVEADPWGNRYALEVTAEELCIRSFGPDGKKGTEDDIVCALGARPGNPGA
jgi:hypothetical protein